MIASQPPLTHTLSCKGESELKAVWWATVERDLEVSRRVVPLQLQWVGDFHSSSGRREGLPRNGEEGRKKVQGRRQGGLQTPSG